MINRIHQCILLIFSLNLLILLQNFWGKNYVNTGFLVFESILLIALFMYVDYKEKKLSIIILWELICAILINYFMAYGVIFNKTQLIIRTLLFGLLIPFCLIIAWVARKKKKGFNVYLLCSMIFTVINFGGVYHSLYSLYFPYGQEGLIIDQGKEYSQALLENDFIYYSADCFFGLDISDVSINYLDYTDLIDSDSIIAKHVDKYDDAEMTVSIIKNLSISEACIFIVYFSIIILGGEDESDLENSSICEIIRRDAEKTRNAIS